MTSLLSLLRKHNNPELPADARTLLLTPRYVYIKCIAGREYAFLGIAAGLNRLSRIFPRLFDGVKEISLQCNIDGLPLCKSSSIQLWPILCKFKMHPFIVAVWSGESKPSPVKEYLSDFLQKYSILSNNGVLVMVQKMAFSLDKFICDAPARAFLKGIKGHCGYYGCERCVVKGEHEGRIIFLQTTCDKHNDEEFSSLLYMGSHQKERTILLDYGINCVNGFILDSMHLVFLGVTKRLLEFITSGPRCCKISNTQSQMLSEALVAYNGKLPREFARQPRSLDYLSRWKATEFREFLLYTGIIVLKKVLSEDM